MSLHPGNDLLSEAQDKAPTVVGVAVAVGQGHLAKTFLPPTGERASAAGVA